MTIVAGDLAPEVASVVVVREDGVAVTATVGGGFFLAWWPTGAQAETFTAFDASGDVIATLGNPMPISPVKPEPVRSPED